MTGREALTLGRRVSRVLVGMALLSDVAAVDPSRVQVTHGKGGHGKHGTTSTIPTLRGSLVLEWVARFRHLVEAAEHELRVAQVGQVAGRSERRTRLLGYQGASPQFVAFVESMTTEAVRKFRFRHGRDPETGYRAKRIEAAS